MFPSLVWSPRFRKLTVCSPAHYLVTLGLGVLLCKAGVKAVASGPSDPSWARSVGPQSWERSNNHLLEIPLRPQRLLPRPVLVSCVPARTPSGPPFLGETTRELQAALHSSFYELCTFHFKDEESEIQNNKLFGKRSVLPWAWVMQATCSCHRLGSRAQLELGSTPAT